MSQSPSSQILKARQIIQSVSAKSLSIEERSSTAVSLAALLLEEAQRIQTPKEKRRQAELGAMMKDPLGKIWLTALTDQCFRSSKPARAADQMTYLINRLGIPNYFTFSKKIPLEIFKKIGKIFANLFVPMTIHMIRKETSEVILPSEEKLLHKHIKHRRNQGVEINLNHLGEAILGEKEAMHRLQIYLNDLSNPVIECVSIKISTLYSQINLLAWEETLQVLADRLRQLYRAAMKGSNNQLHKAVNLDMEEYRDLHCTVALFKQVLDEPEFHHYNGAGIALQSYLPDSFEIQKSITDWAVGRIAKGRSPVKIRIVKGANLAMEQVESAIYGWPQAPYTCKGDVDANFKRMLTYGCQKEHTQAVRLGIGSHNLFDIAYALLLSAENQIQDYIVFEMLEGMADHIRRAVQQIHPRLLLYCPAASKAEFQNAVAYLVRRLDENTAPENFLRCAFDLVPDTQAWEVQAKIFTTACYAAKHVYSQPRREQNRCLPPKDEIQVGSFHNEPDTDWSLEHNRRWATQIIEDWKHKSIEPIPVVIDDKEILNPGHMGIGIDPSYPDKVLYRYTLATIDQADHALKVAKLSEDSWGRTPVKERAQLLRKVALELKKNRATLMGAMLASTGKTLVEADPEISEAIDFANYYAENLEQLHLLNDLKWSPKGTLLVTPPWNFPCSIPAGGILASLAGGNCVLFKPAPEAVLVGWELVKIFWKAGVSRQVLQWICCEDDPVGSYLIKDSRINAVVLTGATETAKLFLRMRPDLDLIAETGGKNTMIITALADRDLAIKNLLHSAFSHAGQKCSACSLAILEAEVYDDPHFRQNLKDAAESLQVGSPWDLKTKINPLIRPPHPNLLRALTTLDSGEEWLLEPKPSLHNPQLWSPAIKIGVKPGSFTFNNELFGPVLGIVRAENLKEAIKIANSTPYGLTAGLQSLDDREQQLWSKEIVAGNCYINRTTTGAIVQRQPFGGTKESSFGRGFKAGGPNYLTQFMNASQHSLPTEATEPQNFKIIQHFEGTEEQRHFLEKALQSYLFYAKNYFNHPHDPSCLLGQDNIFSYQPHRQMTFRVQASDTPLDIYLIFCAAYACQINLEISSGWGLPKGIAGKIESDEAFIARINNGEIERIRLLHTPPTLIQEALAKAACRINLAPALANGRIELLHYLREISLSFDYHRYGNLGQRESEKRSPLVDPNPSSNYKENNCGSRCACQK